MSEPANPEHRAFCESMLPLVSRTFAACIGLLPRDCAYQVLISYLLCRIADTIEDHPGLETERKQALLQRFSASLEDGDTAEIEAIFAPLRDESPDTALTADAHRTVSEFRAFSPAVQQAIAPWVREMCQGMADFSSDQAVHRASQGTSALLKLSDLDRYCYFVAGTVGHLLSDLFPLHHRRLRQRHYRRMKSLATSFGLGLQLTNIIKDVADDHRRGWSFVPRDLCQVHGIRPEDLLDSAHAEAAQQVMQALIAKAQAHLDDALAYCLALPRSAYRIRLFCLTPLYFALATLHKARFDPRLLDPDHKVKISRPQVASILRGTCLVAPNNHLVRAYYRRLMGSRPDLRAANGAGAI